LRGPKFVPDRIKNDADDDFGLATQRDRDAKMRNAVVIIHRSVEWIDHPLEFARLIADDSFFAIECVLRKFFEQRLCDQFLGADIDFEFDIVLGGLIHLHRFLEVVPKHFTGGAGRFNGDVEIMPHERLARTKRKKCTRKTN
jgi:hypothetical protein